MRCALESAIDRFTVVFTFFKVYFTSHHIAPIVENINNKINEENRECTTISPFINIINKYNFKQKALTIEG